MIRKLSQFNFDISFGLSTYFSYYYEVVSKEYNTGELGYDRLTGTKKFGPSYEKSVIYI